MFCQINRSNSTVHVLKRHDPKLGPKLIKCSPTLFCPDAESAQRLMEKESELWDETFQSMGNLHRLREGKINKREPPRISPYHCSNHNKYKITNTAISRTWKPKYTPEVHPLDPKPPPSCPIGNLCHLPPGKPHKRLNERITGTYHPSMSRWFTNVQEKVKSKTYELPITCIKVTWSPRLTSAELCKWLKTFGELMFTMVDPNQNFMYAAFDSMWEAYNAINSSSIPTGVVLAWMYAEYNNFGSLKPILSYRLSADPKFSMVNYLSIR